MMYGKQWFKGDSYAGKVVLHWVIILTSVSFPASPPPLPLPPVFLAAMLSTLRKKLSHYWDGYSSDHLSFLASSCYVNAIGRLS